MINSNSVLITGALGGIGSTLVSKFKEAGYYVHGIDVLQDVDNICDNYLCVDLDLLASSTDYRIKWSKILREQVTSLNVLINNAAVQKLGSLADLDIKDWQATLNVNLTSPLLLSKLFLETLTVNNGSIINIGSIHQRLTKESFISYATSKSALIGLTKALAVDLKDKVRVNSISPAAIETDMLKAGFENNPNALDELRGIHPVGRIGIPKDVAELALFLAKNNQGFIHGANIELDGGISSVLKDL